MRGIVARLVAITLLAGCGGGDDTAEGNAPEMEAVDSTTSETLRSADEVIADDQAEAAVDATLGELVEFANGQTMTVADMRLGGDDGGPWLEVDARIENPSEDDQRTPVYAIICAGSPDPGEYQADSTLYQLEELPSGSFREGTIHLLLPGDGRFGEPTPECAGPAVVRATVEVLNDEGLVEANPTVDVPIDDALLAELNAARAQ
jgi:hypothetical protein